MKKRGRPKSKKADFKKPFPMRYSDRELKLFKLAAGNQPLREWMRETLVRSIGNRLGAERNTALSQQYLELLQADYPDVLEEAKRPVPLP